MLIRTKEQMDDLCKELGITHPRTIADLWERRPQEMEVFDSEKFKIAITPHLTRLIHLQEVEYAIDKQTKFNEN